MHIILAIRLVVVVILGISAVLLFVQLLRIIFAMLLRPLVQKNRILKKMMPAVSTLEWATFDRLSVLDSPWDAPNDALRKLFAQVLLIWISDVAIFAAIVALSGGLQGALAI